ncbi:OmpG family monomeric porin [Shigella flexneri]
MKLTDDLRFNGWLSMYKLRHLNTTGYTDTRVETETGLQYTFNETVALLSELLSRAPASIWTTAAITGNFSTQEIRAYLPLTLGNHSVTPSRHWAQSLEYHGTGRII